MKPNQSNTLNRKWYCLPQVSYY